MATQPVRKALAATLKKSAFNAAKSANTGIGTRKFRRAYPTAPRLAFIITLSRAAKPVREQVVRLQLAEHARPLALAIA